MILRRITERDKNTKDRNINKTNNNISINDNHDAGVSDDTDIKYGIKIYLRYNEIE